MRRLTEYALNILYPKLQEDGVPIIYPEMDFQKGGRKWQSRKRMDGTDPSKNRKDKTEIYMRRDRLYIIEHDEQGDGRGKDLITHYMERHPDIQSDGEAIVKMAAALGLTPPALSPEEERERRKQERLKQFARSMQEALFSDEGKEALSYLKDARGYSEDFISFAEFGYLSPEGASSLRDLYTEMGCSRDFIRKIGSEIGSKFVLAIPYEFGGEIMGFIVRSLSSTDRDKYRAILPLEGTKTKCLFSLNLRKLKGDKEKDRNLTIVEGEIDCLRAQYAGIQNVVAVSGINTGGAAREALRVAKEKGVKRVTFLFDTDEKPDSTDEALKASIENAIAEGLNPYVCTLPPRMVEEEKEDENGKKVKVETRKKEDVDSFLRDHTGEELQRLLDKAESGFWYLFARLWDEATEWTKETDTEGLTDKQEDKFMERLSQIVTSPIIPIRTEDAILQNTEETFGITEGRLHDYMERQQQKADIERQKSELLKTTQKAEELIKADKVEEAFSLLKRKVPESEAISMEAQYSELLKIPTREDIIRRLKEEPEGIRTQYTFWDRKQKSLKERLTIPAGALTFIGAPTSHGKSRFIENLAIHTASEQKAEGVVLYFSFEEDELSVTLQLLNIFADMYIANNENDNNLSAIKKYSKWGDTGGFENSDSVPIFQDKERAFYRDFIESGKLRVYRREYDSGDLIGAIRHITRQMAVRAVFVDYAQLLHKRGTRFQRKEELQEICRDLMNLAIEMRLPIVLAAQVNRQALSPLDMAVQNIAEASDIEHSANVVVLLWNSIVMPLNGSNHYDKGVPSSKEAKELQEMGFTLGERGKMYATIAKNRGGLRNVHAVFDFNENIGAIRGNSGASSQAAPQATQEELPFTPREDDIA